MSTNLPSKMPFSPWPLFRFTVCIALTGVLFAIVPIDARAVELVELYDVELPVQSRASSERQNVFRQGLITVLIRMTGDRNVAAKTEVQALLTEPSRYVQQYRYYERPGDPSAYSLLTRFDGIALANALNRAGLPVWGKERPAVLVWIAVQQQENRFMVGEESDGLARSVVDTLAEQRGVPVMYPLLDVKDRQQVSIADVLGGFDDTIRQASVRYQPDAILVARANTSPDGFSRVDWNLYFGDQVLNWTTDGNQLSSALEAGVHQLANALSERLAIVSNAQQVSQVVLEVEGVNTLEDYARLNAYLADLSQQIRAYRPYRIEPGKASYLLDLRGNPKDLERLFSLSATLGRELQQGPASVLDSNVSQVRAEPYVLRYRLR